MPQRGRRHTDDLLLMALACGATAEAAARKANLGVATVFRRLQDPDFVRRLQKVQADMVQRAARMMTAASTEAIKTFLSLQNSSNTGAVRLGAARAIIELGTRLRESVELEKRITVLEQRSDGTKGN
jgi:hypothetical protein